jgi:signal transduction histidine kinase
MVPMPVPLVWSSIVGRIRSSFMGVLLVIALVVTGVVTYHAYQSSQRHRAIVDRVLHDYVTFASYQLSVSTKLALNSCAKDWFRPIFEGREVDLRDLPLKECANHPAVTFAIDLERHVAHTRNGRLSQAKISWLEDTIARHPLVPVTRQQGLGVLTDPENGATIIFIAATNKLRPSRVTGFVASKALAGTVDLSLAYSFILPPQLTRGTPDSAYFDVQVNAPPRYAKYSNQVALGPEFGNTMLAVSLKPAAVERIVPGGIPKNNAAQLLALLGLAVALVMSALWLLLREKQLARARSGFVSSVSHELRTPLAQIRMFAEMLLLGRVRNEADQRRSIEIIDKEARRLQQLVENVLQVARSERGAIHLNPEQIEMAPLVRDTVESFLVLVEARRIEFRLELQDDLVAPIDPAAVRQIVLNLLDNAAKYGPIGQRVTVGVVLFNDRARLWVDDEGPGIQVRERERVFEAFYRAPRDLLSSTAGSGIGLAVIRELATLHGGSAWIEEAPTGGARVVVEFPAAYVAAEQPATDWAVA